ncbi:MAG: hypothetical protein K8I29_00730 [Alphaproteobacteria bacterium]|uniref:Uncharacterized protein n=1 Tax=Candidatus Nitrobium versatile TaxID=2884831 RepID=A0A953J1V2_9BACT|nr:hypothetical protein [Candidatus Nitrobium versatile]
MGVGLTVELSVEDLAKTIKRLSREDKEELLLLLSEEGKTLIKRHKDIVKKKVKPLTRAEVLRDVV